MHETYEVGLGLALQKDNKFGEPIFFILVSKGIIIAHEVKINS